VVFTGHVDAAEASSSRSPDAGARAQVDGGLISICGGKWTTYRKMAEDAVAPSSYPYCCPYPLPPVLSLRHWSNCKSVGGPRRHGSLSAPHMPLAPCSPPRLSSPMRPRTLPVRHAARPTHVRGRRVAGLQVNKAVEINSELRPDRGCVTREMSLLGGPAAPSCARRRADQL